MPIGTFILVKVPYNKELPYMYEIIDGKQRLATIIEFLEDRFTYKGAYFSDLSLSDRGDFLRDFLITTISISEIEIKKENKKEILDFFIKFKKL